MQGRGGVQGRGRVQGRGGVKMGKEKKGGLGREAARPRKKKERGEGKKGSGKGVLAIPVLVCFRRG